MPKRRDDSDDTCCGCGGRKADHAITGRDGLGRFVGEDQCGHCGGWCWHEPEDPKPQDTLNPP